MKNRSRSAQKTIEINAPVELVWKAVTQAEELTNWFPLNVQNEGNGQVKLMWGKSDFFNLQLTEFELFKHFKVQELPPDSDDIDEILNEQVQKEIRSKKEVLSIDITLTGKKGKTVLRLIHSGFGYESHWDDIYLGVKKGWEFELRGLKHYIENHFGTKRYALWLKKEHSLSLHESWNRFMDNFKESVDSLNENDPYTLTENSGEIYKGYTMINDYPYSFAGTLTNFNNSILRMENYKNGDKVISYFFIAGYSVSKAKIDSIKKRWRKILDTTFV